MADSHSPHRFQARTSITFSTTPASTGRPSAALAARYLGTSHISALLRSAAGSGSTSPNRSGCASKSRRRPLAWDHCGHSGDAQNRGAAGIRATSTSWMSPW